MQNIQIKSIISAIMFIFTAMLAGANASSAAAIDKTSIIIYANTTWDYNRKADQMGWLPQMDFRINGPIANGSRAYVEMTTPDGKPWVSFECQTDSIGAGESFKVKGCGWRDIPNEKFTGTLGTYGVKIRLGNELKGTNDPLFAGKFKVGKAFSGAVATDKDNYTWYVDYDWALPVAEVYADTKELMNGLMVEKEAQELVVSFWYRGDQPTHAYLFYNGNEIGNTETNEGGTVAREYGFNLSSLMPFQWTKKNYTFTRVFVKNTGDPSSRIDPFFMEKNPGEYEVKVLSKGKLVRATKFTVGKDGKIVDTGISRQNQLGTDRITLFATVSGDESGKQPDLQAWKSTAFFEGALKGFGQ
jgi:hypothetical protein